MAILDQTNDTQEITEEREQRIKQTAHALRQAEKEIATRKQRCKSEDAELRVNENDQIDPNASKQKQDCLNDVHQKEDDSGPYQPPFGQR